ncbi:GNAT family N-acetyltransferase [Listeria sp. PSOL-1]|uniref:GNAT family N-acetyltransferase n=1 Tax=Listeria sp. PSOL-1 TaxID=1844999 RepID=UPI0013D47E35|nr:GNAT family N-acetyltransferase [Listeria sp. PSOL-1]
MIRQATMDDATEIAPLLLTIWKDMELSIFKTEKEATIIKALTKAILLPNYRYYYKHIYVYEKGQQIAGVVAGYPSKIEPLIEKPWQQVIEEFHLTHTKPVFVDLETFPNEWYLDSLVTSEEFRGQGIGSALTNELPNIAKASGESVIGLNCDKKNPHAKRLYNRLGFVKVGEVVLGTHLYDHMQKPL